MLSDNLRQIHVTLVTRTFMASLFLFCMCSPQYSYAATDEAVYNYQRNRQAFIDKQAQARKEFDQGTDAINSKIKELQNKIHDEQTRLSDINTSINQLDSQKDAAFYVQRVAAAAFFPLLSTGSVAWASFFGGFDWLDNLIQIGLCISVLNIGLFVLYKGKSMPTMTSKKRLIIIVCMVLFISTIAAPLLASDLENREELIDKLELVGQVLSQSDHQRYIAILEAKPDSSIRIPALQSGDKHFTVFNKVRTDSPEYWYTLAALYTHENMKGRTIEATKAMIKQAKWSNSKNHQNMIINCIDYLLQEQQTELVSNAIDTLIPKISSPSVLLQLATILENNDMRGSAEKVLGQAINRANTVSELLELSGHLLARNEFDKGNKALNMAWQKVKSIKELLQVLAFAIKSDRDELITTIAEEVGKSSNVLGERLKVVDLFLNNQRKEEAITVFSKMINDVNRSSKKKKDHFLFLIDAALERKLLPQARNATNLLFMQIQDHMAFLVPYGKKLESASEIPDKDKITLPQFYGLLNEEQGIFDEAESAYINDLMWSLDQILKSYGYSFPDTMNSFYLLGRTWVRENRAELLKRLDTIYSIIEAQFMNEQKLVEQQQLSDLKLKLQSLEKQLQQAAKRASEATTALASTRRGMFFQTVSTTATILFLILVAAGCIVISFTYARSLTRCKTFGFAVKLVETTGWVRVLTVFGIPSGIIAVVSAQFLELIQQNQENTKSISMAITAPAEQWAGSKISAPAQEEATL